MRIIEKSDTTSLLKKGVYRREISRNFYNSGISSILNYFVIINVSRQFLLVQSTISLHPEGHPLRRYDIPRYNYLNAW